MSLDAALRHLEALQAACQSDPGLWNLVRAEQDWSLYGDACDPLSPAAPERLLKAFQRELYLEVWTPPLREIDAAATVLIAGGGTGRFADALGDRGWRIELIDASPEAVRRARTHLGDRASARVGDLTDPATLEVAKYDAVLAVEVPCYASNPAILMQALRRALRPGGMLLFSVEARPGALFADRDLGSPEAVHAVLGGGVVTLPGMKHVHYYTRDEARGLAEAAGFTVRAVDGVCYVPDGPFGALVDAARLGDREYADALRDLERRCRVDPLVNELPRAWAVAAVAA